MCRLGDPSFERLCAVEQSGQNTDQRLRTSRYFGECDLDEKAGMHQHFIEIDNQRAFFRRGAIFNNVMAARLGRL